MPVDVDVLREEAERLRQEWDRGAWLPSPAILPTSNPGAVAERCIALIAEVIELRNRVDEFNGKEARRREH